MKRMMAVLLSLAFSFGLFASLAVGTGAATVDRIAIDFRSQQLFNQKAGLYQHPGTETEPDVLTGGVYHFVEDGGLQLDYHTVPTQKPYRVMFKVKNAGLTDAYGYGVLVYKATTAATYRATLWNTPKQGTEQVIAENGVDTKGKWVVSEPLILTEVAKNKTILERWLANNINTISFDSTDKNAEFVLKEFAFFKSAADAKAYYAANDPNSDVFTPDAVAEDAKSPAVEDLPDPLVLDLSSTGKVMKSDLALYTHKADPVESGVYELDRDEKAYLLHYANHKNGNYRVMPMMNKGAEYDSVYKYIRVTYKTDYNYRFPMIAANNGTGERVILTDNTGASDGEWVTTFPVDISDAALDVRLQENKWFTLGIECPLEDAKIWIKEIALFASEEQAFAYYGDGLADRETVFTWNLYDGDQTKIREDNSGNFLLWENKDAGVAVYDHGLFTVHDDAVQLLFAPASEDGTPYRRGNYRIMPLFRKGASLTVNHKYVRALYKATNGVEEVDKVTLNLRNNGNWDNDWFVLDPDVKDTNGAYVLSPTAEISDSMVTRLNSSIHATLYFDAKASDGEYYVKTLYFFASKEEADAFSAETIFGEIYVGDTNISEYRIVIGEDASEDIRAAAVAMQTQIKNRTGHTVEVVTDETEPVKHEIILGNTRREGCAYYYGTDGIYMTDRNKAAAYEVAVKDGTVYIAGGMALATLKGAEMVRNMWLGLGWTRKESAQTTTIPSDAVYGSAMSSKTFLWPDPEEGTVETYTDDFEDETAGESPDVWLEHALTDHWTVKDDGKNLVYGVNATEETYSWLHVFERDVEYTARMKVEKAEDDAIFGMLLRFNEDRAYIRVGYDFQYGEWYITDRQGHDYEIYRYDTEAATLKTGEWFTLKAVLKGTKLDVFLNDKAILSTDTLHHNSAGRVGFYANGADVLFDDVELVQTSGQGKVMEGVTELAIGTRPNDAFAAGGGSSSIFELQDGSLILMNSKLHSTDGGITWNTLDGWGKGLITNLCSNLFRLQSGRILQMIRATENGKTCFKTQYSDDDGYTWKDGGVISYADYMGYGTMIGTNQNDKFTQMSDGRIFVSQNYEGTIPAGEPNDHMKVFVEIYYSDDDGITWTKSETASFDTIAKETHFGESKVIEGTDGKLLWMTNWNRQGNMIYSVSEDNGVTWGKAMDIEELTITKSSSGIMTDPHAETLTHYMTMVFNTPFIKGQDTMPRSRLGLFRSYDGINWEYLGDVDRWEDTTMHPSSFIHHYVNPFLTVTKDYVFVGSGRSEQAGTDGYYHQVQTEFIIRFDKDKLEAYDVWPTVY